MEEGEEAMTVEYIEIDMRSTAKRSRELAVLFWNECFRGCPSESEGMLRVQKLLMSNPPVEINGDGEKRDVPNDDVWAASVDADCKWLGLWAHNAFATIETTHRYAAALMCTTAPRDLVDDLVLPWKAVSIRLPSGILYADDSKSKAGARREFCEVRVGVVDVWAQDGLASLAYLRLIDTLGGCLRVTAHSIADMLFETAEFTDAETFSPASSGEARALVVAKRLVFGLLSAVTCTDNSKERRYGTRGIVDPREGPPEHRVIMVGAPISVDARPAVHEYLGGRRTGLPAVQTLVRGHFKRQVIGVSRSGRKVIWVQPYWRGPEDAPILAHPYKVGPK